MCALNTEKAISTGGVNIATMPVVLGVTVFYTQQHVKVDTPSAHMTAT
jgi:hypothetical protein